MGQSEQIGSETRAVGWAARIRTRFKSGQRQKRVNVKNGVTVQTSAEKLEKAEDAVHQPTRKVSEGV